MRRAFAIEEKVAVDTGRLDLAMPMVTDAKSDESFAKLAHDARNMVTALRLYCDLLEERGVLASAFSHYGSELRLIAKASRSLAEKLTALGAGSGPGAVPASEVRPCHRNTKFFTAGGDIADEVRASSCRFWEPAGGTLMNNLAAELLANRNLLTAIAGPGVVVTVDLEGGARPVRMAGEDLTRVLVNLVKNAAEAMGQSGRIQIGLREAPGPAGEPGVLVLTMDDNGPGIPDGHLDTIFTAGYTTRGSGENRKGNWGAHRGQGLAIVRSIIDAAGGCVFAANRPHGGARFEIKLPVRES